MSSRGASRETWRSKGLTRIILSYLQGASTVTTCVFQAAELRSRLGFAGAPAAPAALATSPAPFSFGFGFQQPTAQPAAVLQVGLPFALDLLHTSRNHPSVPAKCYWIQVVR